MFSQNQSFGDLGENIFKKAAKVTKGVIKGTSPVAVVRAVKKEGLKRGLATVGGSAINPLSASGQKVMVGKYNIAGTRAMKKTVAGATGGAATGSASGPWGAVIGAVAGALGANIKKGKAQTIRDVATGAVVGGAAAKVATSLTAGAENAAGTAGKEAASETVKEAGKATTEAAGTAGKEAASSWSKMSDLEKASKLASGISFLTKKTESDKDKGIEEGGEEETAPEDTSGQVQKASMIPEGKKGIIIFVVALSVAGVGAYWYSTREK